MKQTDLLLELVNAKLYAKIHIIFSRTLTMEQSFRLDGAVAMLEHFARTGRIQILDKILNKNQLTIVKTVLFQAQDAGELARELAGFIHTIKVLQIPECTLVLEYDDHGWQLRMTGGNKIMRAHLAAFQEENDRLPVELAVISDKNGVLTMSIAGSDNDILYFAEEAARWFNTSLIF